MQDVAIVGAGELGAGLAHALARLDLVRSIRLIDATGRVAEGKALDISQAAPIEGFTTELSGTTDVSAAAGAAVIVVADQTGGSEWQGEEALQLVKRVTDLAPRAIIVCAGSAHRALVEWGVRELRIPRARLLGSAPEALAAGARALVALELNVSPRDVALAVLGIAPSQIVVSWEHATVAGLAFSKLVDEPARRRLARRIGALWPPGPYALATAACKALEAILGSSRQLACCFVGPDDSTGRRTRAAALPVRLGPMGLVEVVLPPLSVAEQAALDNAMVL